MKHSVVASVDLRQYAVALFDPVVCDWERPVVESLRPVAPSLAARLEARLAGEEAW